MHDCITIVLLLMILPHKHTTYSLHATKKKANGGGESTAQQRNVLGTFRRLDMPAVGYRGIAWDTAPYVHVPYRSGDRPVNAEAREGAQRGIVTITLLVSSRVCSLVSSSPVKRGGPPGTRYLERLLIESSRVESVQSVEVIELVDRPRGDRYNRRVK